MQARRRTLSDLDYRRAKCAELRERLDGIKRSDIATGAGLSDRTVAYFFNHPNADRLPHAHTVKKLQMYADHLYALAARGGR